MDTSLVSERREASDVVVERDVDLNIVRDQILNFLEHLQLVLALDIVAIRHNHPCHQTTKRGDAVPLADADDRSVDVGRAGLESAVGVCNGAARVVVEMTLNVAAYDTTESPDEVVYLSRAGATNSVCDTDSVHADLVDGAVEGEKIDKV